MFVATGWANSDFSTSLPGVWSSLFNSVASCSSCTPEETSSIHPGEHLYQQETPKG